jgi:hypothetical protein
MSGTWRGAQREKTARYGSHRTLRTKLPCGHGGFCRRTSFLNPRGQRASCRTGSFPVVCRCRTAVGRSPPSSRLCFARTRAEWLGPPSCPAGGVLTSRSVVGRLRKEHAGCVKDLHGDEDGVIPILGLQGNLSKLAHDLVEPKHLDRPGARALVVGPLADALLMRPRGWRCEPTDVETQFDLRAGR